MRRLVQLRHETPLTSEAYLAEHAWVEASLSACPRHPRGGCGLARHGTYPRKMPAGMRVTRYYASNLGFSVRALWPFMCGRGLQEKTLGQLKSGLAFHTVPTQAYAANSAWQQLVALAHNLLVNFQIETGAPCRRLTAKRTVLPRLVSIQTLRFTLFHRAAQLVRPQGRLVLRLSDNAATRGLFTRIEAALARAA